jgi:3D (Asp-Asp-Asp) domain-containing protein
MTRPQRGTVAVDPRVIPLGTRLYVPGYGEARAEDTGGAIQGYRIDLFFPTREEALAWGRRTVEVEILE